MRTRSTAFYNFYFIYTIFLVYIYIFNKFIKLVMLLVCWALVCHSFLIPAAEPRCCSFQQRKAKKKKYKRFLIIYCYKMALGSIFILCILFSEQLLKLIYFILIFLTSGSFLFFGVYFIFGFLILITHFMNFCVIL